jgi:hypothetical protein
MVWMTMKTVASLTRSLSLLGLNEIGMFAQDNPAWMTIAIYIGIGLGILVFLIIVFGLIFQRKTTRDITPDSLDSSSEATQPYTLHPSEKPLPDSVQIAKPSDSTQSFRVSDLPVIDFQDTPLPVIEQTALPPVPEDAFGTLSVLNSDDETRVGHQFHIRKSTTTLGRKPDNDIVFAQDKPVSRYHARIEKQDDHLVLVEIMTSDEQGNPKCPTCGTFINDDQINDGHATLKDGDIIQLGLRTRLLFNQGK